MNIESERIVILGAGSAIARATARLWAARGARLVLVGRDQDRLNAVAADLVARGAAQADCVALDCASADAAAELAKMVEMLGGLDILLLAYGVLGDQTELERDPSAAATLIQTNFTSAAAWCLAAAAIFEKQRAGALLVIGSVAGDRGRRSNFIYGATKGGLARVVEGIAHRPSPGAARRPRRIDKARLRRYADDGEHYEKGIAMGHPGASRRGDRGGGGAWRPRGLRAEILAADHADYSPHAHFRLQ